MWYPKSYAPPAPMLTARVMMRVYQRRTSINLRLTDEDHARLVALAEAQRRSINNMLVVLIERAAADQDRPDSPRP